MNCDNDLIKMAFALWDQLEANYPGMWMRRAGVVLIDDERGGQTLNVTARKWAKSLIGFDKRDLKSGLEWVCFKRDGKEFVPALGVLVSACCSAEKVRVHRERLCLPARPHADVSTAAGRKSKADALKAAWASLGVNNKEVSA